MRIRFKLKVIKMIRKYKNAARKIYFCIFIPTEVFGKTTMQDGVNLRVKAPSS